LKYSENNNRIRRIDRAYWPKDFARVNLTKYDDSHIIHDVYQDDKWNALWPLIKLIFNDSIETQAEILNYKMQMNNILNKI
jgi:hypothetical protein